MTLSLVQKSIWFSEIVLNVQTRLFYNKKHSNGRIVSRFFSEIACRVSDLKWWEYSVSIDFATFFIGRLLSLCRLPVTFWWASDSYMSTWGAAQQSCQLLTSDCLKQWMALALLWSVFFWEKSIKIWCPISCLMQNILAHSTWMALLHWYNKFHYPDWIVLEF